MRVLGRFRTKEGISKVCGKLIALENPYQFVRQCQIGGVLRHARVLHAEYIITTPLEIYLIPTFRVADGCRKTSPVI